MGQPQHGYTTRTARAEARPEDSGISSGRLRATRGCRVSRAARHKAPATRTSSHTTTRSNGRAGGAAPVTGPCTRSGALHPFRRGALPTDRVQRPNTQEQTRNWQTESLPATTSPGTGRRAGNDDPVSAGSVPSPRPCWPQFRSGCPVRRCDRPLCRRLGPCR